MDIPNPKNTPPVIGTQGEWQPNTGMDSVARLPYRSFYYDLPKIATKTRIFVWPLGTEGFRRSGSTMLGIHKFLGRNYVAVSEIHRDEAHIEMTGTFAGRTSRNNMADLIDVLTASGAKDLSVPGVFAKIQKVYCTDYDFSHGAEDGSHSIEYTVSFVRTVVGPNVKARSATDITSLAAQPGTNRSAPVKTLSDRTFTVADNNTTLRSVANAVYGDSDQWRTLVDLNSFVFSNYNPEFASIQPFQLALARLPIGTVLRY